MTCSLKRCFKIFLIIFALILLTLISLLQRREMIENEITTEHVRTYFKPPFLLTRHYYDKDSNDSLPMNQLLDMNNFTFYNNCPKLCTKNGSPYLFAFVHSAASHFKRRKLARKTWVSLSTQIQLKFRVAFLLGDPDDSFIQKKIDRESEKYQDIIQGNFVDTYEHLSYKHLMGYKWVLNYCRNVTFVLKVDDDAFIDIFALILYTQKKLIISNQHPKDILCCSVFPQGTPVYRNGRYKLTYKDYPYDTLPKYCSGLAYIVTPDVINDLYYASFKVKPFVWIDDVFVTGILPSVYSMRHLNIKDEFTYIPFKLRRWLMNKVVKPSPYMIGDLEEHFEKKCLIFHLWNKTVMAWKWKMVNESQILIINHNQSLKLEK